MTNQELEFEAIKDSLESNIEDTLAQEVEAVKNFTEKQIARIESISDYAGMVVQNILEGNYDE